ncbi:hypothetical protein [Cohaesibacter celericrescens]|uniref:Uncharacterized protein n=1 Tax=Cohaesibacter celericrescens TaxID=2067669 RepID=A0A2N5XXA6_9HYPH|nr:hypothetical protein [Cohaesibacter celericrescens]PLW79097.1 hypothetical protein C0081_02370 [Cohaesibacter celericrescens]
MSEDTPILRQFSQVLQSISDGDFHQDCSDELERVRSTLVEHMLDFGGEPSGTLTIKLKLKVEKGILSIRPSLDATVPKKPRSTSTLWMTEKGLTPLNPKQMEMFNGKPRTITENTEVKVL